MVKFERIDLDVKETYEELFMNDKSRKENREARITELELDKICDFEGHPFNVKYDDENKKIEINDGKNTKIIDFKTILPIFSQEIIWETIKELQVDALLTISENIKKMSICRSR